MTEWETKPIGRLGRVVTGKTPPTGEAQYFGGGELFVSPRDLSRDSYYVLETETRVTERALEKFKNQVVPKNAVLFTSLSFAFGKMGIATRSLLTNQQINSVIVNSEHNYKFVYYLLRAYESIIFSYNSGIDTPIVPKSVFEGIKVRTPCKGEQRKIAAVLSAYDDLIENNRRRIALLERMAEQLYREWFVRFRFPGYHQAKFEKGIPAGWLDMPASELFDVMSGGTPKTDVAMYWNGEIPFFTPKDATENFYVLDTEKCVTPSGLAACNSRFYPVDTIFITARGTVGKLALAYRPMAMNQSCYALAPRGGGVAYFHFLAMKMAVTTIKGVSNSGVFDNIVVDTFKIVPILLPSEDLVLRFNQLMMPMFQQIGSLLSANITLAKTRDLLLPRLISGKLHVDDLDIQFPPSMQTERA